MKTIETESQELPFEELKKVRELCGGLVDIYSNLAPIDDDFSFNTFKNHYSYIQEGTLKIVFDAWIDGKSPEEITRLITRRD